MPPDVDPDTGDEIEVELRSAVEVAARFVILGCLCRRAFLDLEADGDEAAVAEQFDLLAWLDAERLGEALSPAERAILTTSVGDLQPEVAGDVSWQIEAVAAVAWASGLVDQPFPYDAPVDPAPLLELLPQPWDSLKPFSDNLKLRSEEAIATERERAELWWWRAGLTAADPDTLTIVAEVAAEAVTAGLFERVIGGDFPAHGEAFGRLNEAARDDILIVAVNRLQALNWLCGFGTSWETVPLDIA